MRILQSCLTEPRKRYSCCEPPFPLTTSDCVWDCLQKERLAQNRSKRSELMGRWLFGTRSEQEACEAEALHFFITYIHQLFLYRVRDRAATGQDPFASGTYYADHKLDELATCMRCNYGIDARPFYLHAGIYDPAFPPEASVLAQLPPPFEVPCGTFTEPVPYTPTIDCIIRTWMVVSDAVDASDEPDAITGSTYLIVSDTGNIGTGWGAHVGQIAYTGGYLVPPVNSIIRILDGRYFRIASAGVVEDVFPPLVMDINGNVATIAAAGTPQARTVIVRASNGTAEQILYQGPETGLPAIATLTLTGQITTSTTYVVDGCAYGPYSLDPDVVACTPQFSAAVAVDAFEESTVLAGPATTVLIITDDFSSGNNFAAQLYKLATTDGLGGVTYQNVAIGDKVMLATGPAGETNGLYIKTAGAFAQYHPGLSAVIDITQLNITTPWTPEGHNITSRNILIEIRSGSGNWTQYYSGPEIVLQGGYTATVPLGTNDVRVRYLGACPLDARIQVTLIDYPPRSLRLNGRVIARTPLVYPEPYGRTTLSMGTWLKANTINPAVSNEELYLELGSSDGKDDITERNWRVYGGLVRLNAYGGRFLLQNTITEDDPMGGPSPIVRYNRYWEVLTPDGSEPMDVLLDGDWHMLTLVKNGPARSAEKEHWKVYVDDVEMLLGAALENIGDLSDVPATVVWETGPGTPIRAAYVRGSNTTQLHSTFKNVFLCDAALTVGQINSIVRRGLWEANAAAIGLRALWNFNLPDVLNANPYMGSKFATLTIDPYGGTPIAGGQTAFSDALPLTGTAFVTDIPPDLVVR